MKSKYCISCGKEITENTRFCPFCGAAQSSNESSSDVINNVNTEQKLPNPRVTTEVKNAGLLLLWGWIVAVLSLFIPILGIISIVLGYLSTTRKATIAGVVLIVFSIIFIYLGMTGFGPSFIESFNEARSQ